jgi:adenylate cyclase
LWAERYDRNQEDIFAVQDQVIGTIVATLVGRLHDAGTEKAKRKLPANLDAYECLLRAEALDFSSNPATHAEARGLLEKALELDPGYALAYAFLATLLHIEWYEDIAASNTLLDRALELAKRAVSLDPHDEFVQRTIGYIHLIRQFHDLAGQHYGKALELNRNKPQLLAALVYFHACLGEPDVALAYYREAKLLDPLFDPAWSWEGLAVTHFVARRYSEAIVALGRSTTSLWSLGYLAACQALADRMDSARASAAETVRLAPAFSAVQFVAKEPFKRLEDRQLLLDGLRKAGLPE